MTSDLPVMLLAAFVLVLLGLFVWREVCHERDRREWMTLRRDEADSRERTLLRLVDRVKADAQTVFGFENTEREETWSRSANVALPKPTNHNPFDESDEAA